MKSSIVGYTGFVGSNICASHLFDGMYNTKNIESSFGTRPELLIYAGVRAEKFIANLEPDKDRKHMEQAMEIICRIHPVRLVLISTVDVFSKPVNVDESAVIDPRLADAYGANRYYLECMVKSKYPGAYIIRLPALFGNNIKKNFIYDYINPLPSMLSQRKMEELSESIDGLEQCYQHLENGFYRRNVMNTKQEAALLKKFQRCGFTALNFTDSRSRFQFYNLANLWQDIERAMEWDIKTLNLATEPISAGEVYRYLSGKQYLNELSAPLEYNFRSIHAEKWGGQQGYLYSKKVILSEIKKFVDREKKKAGSR